MTAAALTKQLDKAAKHADRIYGQKATLTDRSAVSVDVTTGAQTTTDTSKTVVVRPWPLSIRDRSEFASAGLTQVDTRWSMRVAHAANIEPGDILTVGSFNYVVVDGGATKDEHGVEWTILTRRRR